MHPAEARRTPTLAHRDAELARLAGAFEGCRTARNTSIVLVRGPSGVGRTSLLSAFTARLPAGLEPALVAPHSAGRAFSPLSGLVPALVARAQAAGHAARAAALTATLAPVVGGKAAAGLDPAALGDAFASLVAAAAADAPLVLLFDDLHAADATTLGVLGTALQALATPPALRPVEELTAGVFIVLAFSDDVAAPALSQLVSRVPALSLPLLPFDADGLRAYLGKGPVIEQLLSSTGGVPARLEALLTGPGAIDLAARRLEKLAAADREALVVLALAGRPVPASVVIAATTRKDSAARLARLADDRLVTASPGAGATQFSVSRPDELRALNRDAELVPAVAAALVSFDPVRAAALFAEAGDAAKAVECGLPAAAALEANLQWHAARGLLETLLPVARGASRVEVSIALARVCERLGDLRAALAATGRARAASSSKTPMRARAARLVGVLGRPVTAERLARGVLGAKALAADVRAEATLALADARFVQGAYAEVLALTDGAALPLALANVRGKAFLTLGRLDDARETFEDNARRAEAEGDRTELARALLNVGVVAHRAGNREIARHAYREAVSSASGAVLAIARANLSSLSLEDGRADDALAESVRAIAAFRTAGRAKEEAHAVANLARIHLYLGDAARALEVAHHAGALAQRVGDPYVEANASLVAAEAHAESEPAAAATRLVALAGTFEKLGNPRYQAEAALGAAAAFLRTDDVTRAAEALTAVPESTSQVITAERALCDAELRLRASDVAGASAALSAARKALLAEPHLELPARLFHLQGLAATARHEPDAARAEHLEAVRVLESLAARLPPERRGTFLARPSRRSILAAAGLQVLREVRPSIAPARTPRGPEALVGRSAAIVRVNALVDRLGPTDATVLVRGESGTGKELVARALHERSARRDGPWVAVNCGALNEELLLSELFGHEKGSFTGAIRDRKGRFEQADGGTLFLDEVGDISPRAQVALLRALQEREFERVGGGKAIRVDVRVVCATNRDLEDLMSRGLFREDLYYRLRGATLTLPALRERPDDLPVLVDHHFARRAADRGEPTRRLTPSALRLLAGYRWPGNVRELQNVLESAALFATDAEIGPEAFELSPELFSVGRPAPKVVESVVPVVAPAVVAAPLAVEASVAAAVPPVDAGSFDFYAILRARDVSLKDLRAELEVACISRALLDASGNISEAARLLKMKRSRLSQIVNAEPSLRGLCRGAVPSDDADDDGPDVAGEGK